MLERLKKGFVGALDDKKQNEHDVLRQFYGAGSIFSDQNVSFYIEDDPSVFDWVRNRVPKPSKLITYTRSLFPFISWISNYNISWFMGDLVAGLTIGAVVVPQGMAYALLAGLPPQYGMYSSFMGVLVYWLFGTSKDISIGPVAVISVLTGKIVLEARETHPDIPGPVIASAVSLVCGIIISFIGLMRCGWIIGFIPLVSTAAFTTGSAINITIGQLPALLGIRNLAKKPSTFETLIQILKNISRINLDAAIGLSALFLLYFIRSACSYAIKKFPQQQKRIFFISTLRTVFVIFLCTMISWLVNRKNPNKPRLNILSNVPGGFTVVNLPVINGSIISIFIKRIPVIVILLLIEHIAIAKTFGRVNNYVINPSQEMVAIGVTNVLGPFIGGFTATGSFSRTAINSKAGARTPLAGIMTAGEVLLAIYALPAVFFYIPFSVLSAVIIHSVLDLITPPSVVHQFWRISPIEVPVFFAGIFVTVFTTLENGIYVTAAASFLILIVRFSKSQGKFLGKIRMHFTSNDSIFNSESDQYSPLTNEMCQYNTKASNGSLVRDTFPPLDFSDGTNPEIDIQLPQPGVFVYQFSENFSYLNASQYLEHLTSYIFAHTRRTNQKNNAQMSERLWNDSINKEKLSDHNLERPILRAIIFDFSAVNYVDITSVQQLVDVRNQLDIYASPGAVDWHFCNIKNPWTKRGLLAAGFGRPSNPGEVLKKWQPIFGIAKTRNLDNESLIIDNNEHEARLEKSNQQISGNLIQINKEVRPQMAMVRGSNYPFFHADLMGAWLNVNTSSSMRESEAESQEC
ncbi:Sulfate permease 2 [Golovinomyces cichoracearum]|uniref:Sulfate permease 2 n=1 Tax=Golovinomyces cichoracearum TaxID=62708 RepID=A0A420INA4_9PEZI|nr:Sulfate permease 2 [Golovinomyces cichoracearum]